jgi:hypothetical protein
MTGPDHFRRAEQLLEHASAMLDTEVAPQDRAELVARQAAVATMADAHALLAAAAALGLSARLAQVRPAHHRSPDRRLHHPSTAQPGSVKT